MNLFRRNHSKLRRSHSKPLQIWDFHGGIYPAEHKTESNQTAVVNAALPKQLIVPVQQHLGNAAEIQVAVGERVLKGQVLASAQGGLSVPVHAPSSGHISAIEARPIAHASGMTDLCVIIDTDGQEQWLERKPEPNYSQLAPEDLVEKIRQAGIAGLGGAGFPTAVKLKPPKPIDTLIINGTECEPYITADDRLMREQAREILLGIDILLHILKPQRCLIGVEDNKPEAINALQQALSDQRFNQPAQVQVVSFPTKYPSGGEKQLIQILTGKQVPQASIPADIGIVCQNVGTTAAIYRAIVEGQPLISRITTLSGGALRRPQNLHCLIGTPFKDLLEQAGLDKEQMSRVIMGGPMMGFSVQSLDVPVVKTTNCILAPSVAEAPAPQPEQACIRCGSCAQVCPANLLPQQLYWHVKAQELDKAQQHNLFDCIECGACAYVCPSNIPLVQYYRFGKAKVREEIQAQQKAEHSRIRFEARQERLAQEQAEKEARRQQRAAKSATLKASPSKANTEAAGKAVQTAEAKPTDKTEAADKAALIEAALQRVAAKKAQSGAPTPARNPAPQTTEASQTTKAAQLETAAQPSPSILQRQLRSAEKRLLKAEEKLKQAEAEQNQQAIIEQQQAIQKQQAKIAQTQQALAEGGDNHTTEPNQVAEKSNAGADQSAASLSTVVAVEPALLQPAPAAQSQPAAQSPVQLSRTALERQLKGAEKRLQKAEEKLKLAAAEQDQQAMAELQQAIQKQQNKITQTQQALANYDAKACGGQAAILEDLKQQWEKQQIRVTKAEAKMASANDAQRPALQTTLEQLRNQANAAQQAYETEKAKSRP